MASHPGLAGLYGSGSIVLWTEAAIRGGELSAEPAGVSCVDPARLSKAHAEWHGRSKPNAIAAGLNSHSIVPL